MKKLIFSVALLSAALSASAEEHPLWMRYPAISPDGTTIAFAYKGDLYSVSVNGGEARQLTTHAAFDSHPVWSPDSKKIAFQSNREGSLDIFVIDAKGGAPTRLTTNSGSETPIAFADNDHVLYSASLQPTAQSIIFGDNTFPQVYKVSTKGGRPELFSTLTMENISIAKNGDILYHDKKGYEDPWRKHQKSPIARDIWLKSNGKFTKQTTFAGEDRSPVWTSDEKSFFYLSEQDGTFNIYRRSLNSSSDKQITHHKGNPVRFLTASSADLLCYGYDGEIYTVKEGGEPQKVNISITTDNDAPSLVRQIKSWGATEISVSPDAKEVAFVMHGDVYVTSVEYTTTKRITDTPQQERDLSFSPDGRALVYAAERNGVWQIYQSKIKNEKEKNFTYATDIEEEQLVKTGVTSYPQYSPDGKEVAFFEDRAALRIINLKSKEIRTVLDGKYVYSYSDGDIAFEWSPDSKWLLSTYIGNGGWNNQDIALVKADGKEVHNLTNSGYSDSNGKWVLDGKAMLFQSDRAGYRSHGSWGAEDDAYIMFFDLDAYNRFNMSKEEIELSDANKDEKEKKEDEKKEEAKKKADEKQKKTGKIEVEKVKPLELDIENCRDRIVRLTANSSHMGDAVLSKDGDKLYYQAAFEDDYDLWQHDLKDGSTKLVMKGVGQGNLQTDKDVKNLFICNGSSIKKVDLSGFSTKDISFEANFNYKPAEERQYLFDHIWRQVKDKFYDPKIHGVDWEGYRKTYEKFLPYINNNFDFQEMLSEMLGELNASHTGARYYASNSALTTANLGVFFDPQYQGDGLKIQEIIKRGPFDVKNTGVTAGSIIESIDGEEIKAGMDYFPLLDGKVGKNVRLGIRNAKGKKMEVTVKAISQGKLNNLLYKRWVDRNRAFVDSISGGRIAYVHVKAMDSESFRTVYSELLSDKNRNRDAVIVDERHNGGGWLHDDLCTLLNGKQYQEFVPHGKVVGRDPFNKWVKPSCVMICENDYSNGHGFPWVYKELGIGKLIGAPVAGTMTAVWWETLMDNTLVFGIPQVGCRDMRGVFGENTQLNPDIEVYNSPEDFINGHDTQLERAVKEMMKK